MRIDEKLAKIRRATNADGLLYIEVQQRYGDGREIINWKTLQDALAELLTQNWMPNSERIQDFVETPRGTTGSTEDSIVMSNQDYSQLEQLIRQSDAGMPVAMEILQTLAPDTNDDSIFIEIGRVDTADELNNAIKEITDLLQVISIGGAFEFQEFSHGSDWLAFLADPTTAFAFYCVVHMATKWRKKVAEYGETTLRSLVNAAASVLGDAEQLTGEKIMTIQDRFAENELADDWHEIHKYLNETLGETRANEALSKLKLGARTMRDQMEKGRDFQPSISISQNITVIGDGNKIDLSQTPRPIAEPPQLQSANTDSTSNEENG